MSSKQSSRREQVFLAFLEFLYTDEVLGLSPSSSSALPSPLPATNNRREGHRAMGGGNNPHNTMEHLSFAMDLLSLADQYLLDALKRKCEHAILKGITASNVAMMLATADARNAMDLRRRCLDYILANFARVIPTTAFAELPTPLLHEVLVEASKRGVQIGTQSNDSQAGMEGR